MVTANYKCLSMVDNGTIKKNEFACIMFHNVGTQDVYVNGLLVKPDTSLEFNEDYNIFINSDFNIVFDGDVSKKNLLNIVETFYKQE